MKSTSATQGHQGAQREQRQRCGFGDGGKEAVKVVAAVVVPPDDIAGVDAEGGDIGPSPPWRVKSGVGRAESVLPIVTIRVDRKEAA